MKFCFWGHIADAIRGTTIGGGELQMALLAKSLSLAGHEVVIIDPYSKESFTTEEGVKVIHIPGWNKGLPGIRFFLYRIPALYKLFVKQKADYYYVRMRSYLNLISYLAAKKVKGKFLLAIASDLDVSSLRDKYKFEYKANFKLFKYLSQWLPNDLVFKSLLKKAHYVIRQHSGQEVNKYILRGKVITFPNIIDRQNLAMISNPEKKYYIYVGSLTILKGVDKLYEIIRGINKENLVMVVGQPNDNGAKPIFEQLRKLENADVRGRKSHVDAVQLIANAKALINTSEFEGFPNVFLEAWTMGIPVLSLKVNPGGIFDKYNFGVCFKGDLEKMKEYIGCNAMNSFDRKEMTSYIGEFHDFNTAAERFVDSLNSAV